MRNTVEVVGIITIIVSVIVLIMAAWILLVVNPVINLYGAVLAGIIFGAGLIGFVAGRASND
jgi:hypothetical protein